MNEAERRPFLLFGHTYQWTHGYKLVRIEDEQARCSAELDRDGILMRCHYLVGHAGRHQTTPNAI